MADKDIISKETIRRLAVDLATHLLKLPIDPDSLEACCTGSGLSFFPESAWMSKGKA
uniref:Uncharacterized protein n=1 Tax=Candidatus Kentrum sp. FW TaxID=2126338 RepID=A0A450RYJ1_9GAMM|nr:MAG: hypothetical protein BECKFW1821A_GA0114235_100651 [Candidatus Kentron sp. FW]VFJ57869.1 MAG: hypothetical protein BECKFW1821B_GA0114236_103721 [Candidatus Kentron sp. FW]